MSIPSRMNERMIVLSKLKQANYSTLVSDANLQAGKRFAPAGPLLVLPTLALVDDVAHAMKGHDYATQEFEAERDIRFPVNWDGPDTWKLGHACAFAFGAVTSVQPNPGTNPTAWKHTYKAMDPAVAGKDVPVTTIYREWANTANGKGKLHSCALARMGLSFPPGGKIQLTEEWVGSGQETLGALATPPSLTSTLVTLLSNNLLFEFGPQGAPVDITSEIVRGSIEFSFGLPLDDENSRHPGSGLYRGRMWYGQPGTPPQATLSWRRFVDDATVQAETDYLARTVREVKVTLAGATIGAGPEKHQIVMRGLAVRPKTRNLGQAGDKTVYEYSVGPNDWYKEGSNDVLVVEVQNLETSYLV